MVFSFFKKPPQKMPERASARPRAPLPEMKLAPEVEGAAVLPEPLPDLEFTSSDFAPPAARTGPSAGSPASLANPMPMNPNFSIDEFEDDFTESSVMAIDVEHDIDPLQADVEQVVVMYANGQDAAARKLLEMLLKSYSGVEGTRLWSLLLDLLQIQGERAEFDRLCVEFAQVCETSPPAWRGETVGAQNSLAGGVLMLQGVLTADDTRPLEQFDRLVQQPGDMMVDMSKVVGCDDSIAGALAERLIAARRQRKPLRLVGGEALMGRLNERLQAGDAVHEPSWRLLLELLQRMSTQAHFEERAVEYAITFEQSPPSWEGQPPRPSGAVEVAPVRDTAIYLSGDLKNQRFDELAALLDGLDPAVIDFSGVRRLDFFSAGQLVNRLAPLKAAGRDVLIRSPNHLVAELMAVVGLNKQARIIVPKS